MSSLERVEEVVYRLVHRCVRKADSGLCLSPDIDLRRQLEIDSIELISLISAIEQDLDVDLFSHADELAEAQSLADLIVVVMKAANGTERERV